MRGYPQYPAAEGDVQGSLALLTAQIREWRMLLAELYQAYGIPMNTENCCYLYSQTQNYRIGDVIRKRRKMLGLSVRELCEGICSEKTLRRLENNKTRVYTFQLCAGQIDVRPILRRFDAFQRNSVLQRFFEPDDAFFG